MAADVAVVLVNYNAGEELRTALQSASEELSGRTWEGVVVDNASIDGSGVIATEFSQVRLLQNTQNVGFGRGVNQAVAVTEAPLVLVMNPDCRLSAGALAALERTLTADPACAVVGPRILDPDGSVQGSARGDPDMLTGLFGRASALRRLMPGLAVSRRNVVDGGAGTSPSGHVVDWVSGACMLVRREAFARARGFDERFFLYWEDADLCRRLRALGYRIRYDTAATAVHRVGHSSRTVRPAAIRAFHKSAYLYYATHVAPASLNPKRLLARTLLAARCWWLLRQS